MALWVLTKKCYVNFSEGSAERHAFLALAAPDQLEYTCDDGCSAAVVDQEVAVGMGPCLVETKWKEPAPLIPRLISVWGATSKL